MTVNKKKLSPEEMYEKSQAIKKALNGRKSILCSIGIHKWSEDSEWYKMNPGIDNQHGYYCYCKICGYLKHEEALVTGGIGC